MEHLFHKAPAFSGMLNMAGLQSMSIPCTCSYHRTTSARLNQVSLVRLRILMFVLQFWTYVALQLQHTDAILLALLHMYVVSTSLNLRCRQ